jgi:hypothetical protein
VARVGRRPADRSESAFEDGTARIGERVLSRFARIEPLLVRGEHMRAGRVYPEPAANPLVLLLEEELVTKTGEEKSLMHEATCADNSEFGVVAGTDLGRSHELAESRRVDVSELRNIDVQREGPVFARFIELFSEQRGACHVEIALEYESSSAVAVIVETREEDL